MMFGVAYFFLRFITLSFFLFIFLKKEFRVRKANNQVPRNLRELFNLGSKWKIDSDPRIAALLFASSSFLGFSLWESLILSALDVYPYLFITLPLGVTSAGLLLRKKENAPHWGFRETLWAFATLGLLSGAFYCWGLFPWLYYRARFLKVSAT